MTSMFLFSFELQTTIGTGEKYPTDECPEGVFIFILQVLFSVAIEGALLSTIYAKTTKPKKILSKLKFSEKAVVSTHICLFASFYIYFFRFVIETTGYVLCSE